MKKIIFAALCFVALNSKAQKIDTVKNAIQVQPVVVNALNEDTCYQVSWSVFGINRNDTLGAISYVQLFDRKAKSIAQMNVAIPYIVLSAWLDDKVIDNWILFKLKLTKRN